MAADYTNRLLPQFQASWDHMRETQASPFRSLCMPGCCESGLCAEEAGTRLNLFGVNTLGIGTLVDSLWAVKRLVYDERELSLPELQGQLAGDFPDKCLLNRCRNLPGKYGSDNPETNALAAEFAHHVADLVLDSRLEHNVRPYPALFIFTAWAQMTIAATPDGRRSGEAVSYGVGPSVLCNGKTPTSVLKSSALTANDRCGCGNPMFVTMNRADVHGDAGRRRLRQTVETYFREGGYHVHMNILDAGRLREARLAEIPVYFGEVLSEEAHYDLDVKRFAALVATTSNDAYNALVCTNLGPEIGRTNVFEIPTIREQAERKSLSFTLGGRPLTRDPELRSLDFQLEHIRGWGFQATRITEEFSYQEYLDSRAEGARVILWRKPSGKLVFRATTEKSSPEPGDLVISFAPPRAEKKSTE